MVQLNTSELQILGLSAKSFTSKSKEEALKMLRRRWLTLCRTHPDKNRDNPDATNTFNKIHTAYYALVNSLSSESGYKAEIEDYYNARPVDIPETAFDLNLVENIEAAHGDLLKHFRQLDTKAEKQAFGKQYGDFLNLATSLKNKRHSLVTDRIRYFDKNTFLESLIQDWRKLILQLYAEEYLDDFEYRQAIAHGIAFSMLAKRKLISPLKLLAAFVNSVLLIISRIIEKILSSIMLKLASDFHSIINQYKNGDPYLAKAFLTLVELLLFTGSISVLGYLAPTATYLLLSLPFFIKILNLIACPINNIIRPLAKYTGIQPEALTVLTLLGLAGAATALMQTGLAFISLPLLIELLPLIILALTIPFVIEMVMLIKNIYDRLPSLGIFMGTFMLVSTAVSVFLSSTLPEQIVSTAELVSTMLYQVYGIGMFHAMNYFMKHFDTEQNKLFEDLPLPEKPVPDDIKQAALQGNKIATQSAKLFNTPTDAHYLKPEQRGFSQCVSSLFGGGSKTTKTTPKPAEQPEPKMALVTI